MRIAVAELPKPQGSWPLSTFVVAAITIANGEVADLIGPDDAISGSADALIWEAGYEGDAATFAQRGMPVARVVLSDKPPGPAVSARLVIGPQPDDLRVDPGDFNAAALTIANWLRSVLKIDITDITVGERRMLEVVLGAVRKALDAEAYSVERDTAAQVQAAADTVDAQLRAPSPSRRIVSWALAQFVTFPSGVITGVAATYLVELIHHFAS